jgi:hypothetical protein
LVGRVELLFGGHGPAFIEVRAVLGRRHLEMFGFDQLGLDQRSFDGLDQLGLDQRSFNQLRLGHRLDSQVVRLIRSQQRLLLPAVDVTRDVPAAGAPPAEYVEQQQAGRDGPGERRDVPDHQT